MTDTKSAQPEALFNAEAVRCDWPTRADPAVVFQNESFAALADLWRAKAANGLPKRSDFSARELKRVLRHLLIVEYVPQATGVLRLRVRFIGSGVGMVTGDMTGHFLDEFIPPQLYPRWQAALATAESAGRPMRLIGRIDLWGQQHLTAEIFAAPLAAEGNGPAMAMAAFRFHATVAENEPAQAQPLVNAR